MLQFYCQIVIFVIFLAVFCHNKVSTPLLGYRQFCPAGRAIASFKPAFFSALAAANDRSMIQRHISKETGKVE